jgi:acetyl esterase/lipase
MHLTLRPGLIAACLCTLGVLQGPAQAAPPPVQPTEGPGGVGDRAATIVKRGIGRAAASSFIFHKSGTAPAEGRPVAVFLHAWGAPNPQAYGAWIDHLARTGYLVVFPRFQEINRTRPADASANAERLLKAAFAELATDAEAKPDPKRVALIGHLAGAPIAANIAADAAA